jgi:tRNA threonylcarbamoyladenosine biosynthesis protein TsaB
MVIRKHHPSSPPSPLKGEGVRLLAIETSSPRLSLALGTESHLIKEYQGPLAWRHAESLFDGMQRLLKQARWPVQSLTGVLVSTGPGSFTGIRIGLAAARALGQSLKIPVVGVSSLRILAYSQLKPRHYVCPIINALRGEVFTALYKMETPDKVKTVWKEVRLPWPELLRKLKHLTGESLYLVGDIAPYQKDFQKLGGKRWKLAASGNSFPQAGVLLRIGRGALARAKADSYGTVLPLYLRSAAAQERQKV